MINEKRFHNNIEKTINQCSYPIYAVLQYPHINCTCFVHATKQPDVTCKKCLGTGHKIRIKKIEAAVNESVKGGTALGVQSSYTVKRYFINSAYKVSENDLLIEEDTVYYVHRTERMRALKGYDTHVEVTGVKRKAGHDTILKNFNDIIKQHYRVI